MVTFDDLMIRTKDRRLAKFVPNAVQVKYLDALQETQSGLAWREGRYRLQGVREDILKARQQGMSTLWLALYFLDTINTPLTQTLIVAHTREATERLFRIVWCFYQSLPPDTRPPTRYASRSELTFEETGSSISVGTAGNLSVGRGATLHNLHLSERAFWRDGATTEAGLLEAVPDEGNITRETTANGLNDYYEERTKADNGESEFTPRFFGWFLAPEYRMPAPHDFCRTPTEEQLARTHDLDDAQLQWRRGKLQRLGRRFAQEYPCNPREAFLTSGNPYFDREMLQELSDRLQSAQFDPLPAGEVRAELNRKGAKAQREEKGEKSGDVEKEEVNISIHPFSSFAPSRLCGLLSPREAEGAALQVWELPQAGRRYVIGADTSEGLSGRGDHDWCSADVLDAQTWAQVAHLHGRWEPHEYGLLLCELGFWFNTALLGIERNNHGHAVISAALHDGEYPPAMATGGSETGNEAHGLYFHGEDETGPGAKTDKQPSARRPGWPTTTKTKYLALDGLAASLAEGELQVRCRQTVSELLTFVQLPGGRAGGEGRSHDDRVTSLSIADALLKRRASAGRPSLGEQMTTFRELMK